MLKEHPNLTSTLIARLLFSEIVKTKDFPAKNIQNTVKARWKYDISYGKAWRAKQAALEQRFGTFLDSYDNVVRLLRTLQYRNPGTYVDRHPGMLKAIKALQHPSIDEAAIQTCASSWSSASTSHTTGDSSFITY